jgi:GNAT superfamily N-acetyltransferase
VILIRPFLETGMSDALIAAAHLSIRRWQEANGQNEFPDILDSQFDLNNIEDFYIKPGGEFFVATYDQYLVGFVGLRCLDEETLRLKRMMVSPGCQRQGIGHLLLDAAISWARNSGFKSVVPSTGVRESGRFLYDAHGFTNHGPNAAGRDFDMSLIL